MTWHLFSESKPPANALCFVTDGADVMIGQFGLMRRADGGALPVWSAVDADGWEYESAIESSMTVTHWMEFKKPEPPK